LYCHPLTGELVPSVTTIIAMLNKPLLTGWAARLAAEYAVEQWENMSTWHPRVKIREIKGAHERERDASAVRGTAVHAAIDDWCQGKAHSSSPEISPYMGSFMKFLLEKRPTFLRTEVTLWNRKHNYAGTADAICVIAGETWLIDYKTGKNLHDEVGLQLSALAHGEFIITPEGEELPVPLIHGIAAVHIRPRSWKFVPVQHDKDNFSAFIAARELYRWSTEVRDEVLAA
jgi:hypothetical protein